MKHKVNEVNTDRERFKTPTFRALALRQSESLLCGRFSFSDLTREHSLGPEEVTAGCTLESLAGYYINVFSVYS